MTKRQRVLDYAKRLPLDDDDPAWDEALKPLADAARALVAKKDPIDFLEMACAATPAEEEGASAPKSGDDEGADDAAEDAGDDKSEDFYEAGKDGAESPTKPPEKAVASDSSPVSSSDEAMQGSTPSRWK